MKSNALLKYLCVAALVMAHLHLSYDFYRGWWLSALGLAVILAIAFIAWKNHFLNVVGLRIRSKEVAPILLTAFGATILSFCCLYGMSTGAGISISVNSVTSYVHNVFYIINEEIVLGALLLGFLIRKARLSPLASSLALAAVASLAHLALYKWYFRNPGTLCTETLATLFLVAFFKNNLILRAGHIGYAWAFHFGWMAVMFGSLHHFSVDGRLVTDLEKFNLYLGSYVMLGISLLLVALSVLVPAPYDALELRPLRLWRKREQ